MNLAAFKLDYKPKLSLKYDCGISIVSCDSSIEKAHLLIYRKHNLSIVGCFDARREKEEGFANQFSISWVEMTEVFAHEG